MNQYYYHKVYIVVLIYISNIALNEISCTIEHLLHEPIIVDAIIARMVLLKLIPVISEYLFEDAPSGCTFMIHRK